MKDVPNLKSEVVLDEEYEADYLFDYSNLKVNWSMKNFHKHNLYEIYYLVSGKVHYIINSEMHTVKSGDIVVVPMGVRHTTLTCGNMGRERLLFYFSEKYRTALEAVAGRDTADAFLCAGIRNISQNMRGRVTKIFGLMKSECDKSSACRNTVIASLFFELVSIVMADGTPTAAGLELDNSVSARVERAAGFVYSNYDKQITLSDAASVACLERTYFSKIFKRIMGIGFSEYLSEVRLGQAMEQLRDSELSVGDIAVNCGFTNINYFGDFFKKHVGKSPSEYRRFAYGELHKLA